MQAFPYISDRRTLDDAQSLIARFGDDAGFEATVRAEASRDRGNVVAFCHWRQIERLIAVLGEPAASGTVH